MDFPAARPGAMGALVQQYLGSAYARASAAGGEAAAAAAVGTVEGAAAGANAAFAVAYRDAGTAKYITDKLRVTVDPIRRQLLLGALSGLATDATRGAMDAAAQLIWSNTQSGTTREDWAMLAGFYYGRALTAPGWEGVIAPEKSKLFIAASMAIHSALGIKWSGRLLSEL